MKRLNREEDGAVAVIMAIVLVVLMVGVALSVDIGGLMLRRREMVNGSDAAAHAAAVTYVRNKGNFGVASAVDAEFRANAPSAVSNSPGGYHCSYEYVGAVSIDAGTVRVTCNSTQPLYFAPVFGFDDSHEVSTTADASWKSDGAVTGGTIHPWTSADLNGFVYVCKYSANVNGANGQVFNAAASGWKSYNSGEVGTWGGVPWNGQTGFNDTQSSFIIAAVAKEPQKTKNAREAAVGVNPVTDCPQPGPHVWLSN